MTIDLDGSPYSFEETGGWVWKEAAEIQERVDMLRQQGKLSEQTLHEFFGDTRFRQIAESNAIEGSTLDVGETELAVMKGVTITGHDPAYSKDAVNLSKALERMVELARDESPTTLDQVKELHSLILAGAPGAGLFRSQPVRIAGSDHRPPASWEGVMSEMEDWESWSSSNEDCQALLRAIVLHTWLTHIHPFTDGNGRTSRAVMNLELIRAGFPSVIIRRKDRLRYYEALAESDLGGDLGPISELILARTEDALRELERTAAVHDGYDPTPVKIRRAQERQAAIWNDAVRLLFSLTADALGAVFDGSGEVSTRWYDDELLVEDYAALEKEDPAGNSWLYRIDVKAPLLGERRWLAWTGYRSREMKEWQDIGPGPSIFWSVPAPSGSRPWTQAYSKSPGVEEFTLQLPNVDQWIGRLPNGEIKRIKPSEMARKIAQAVVSSMTGP